MSSKETGVNATTVASPSEQVKFSERFNAFLYANRKSFMALGIATIVLVVGIGIYSVASSASVAKSTVALEQLESDYDVWLKADESGKAPLVPGLLVKADAVISRYARRYAGAKATMIKAELLVSSNDLSGAEKAYASLAAAAPKSHLAPVALANAASVAENRGDNEAALAYLTQADTAYPEAPGIGRVVLSIGRLYEGMKQYDKAMDAYGRLIASGIESDWTKLAHDRIILLKSLGLVK
ncbi:MAG: hypothetical protein CVV51_02840 [Spirochaetae bacterium HGW-Spirochaetae-7]|jgi:tetratricopeptide (TPR) repeat protein|nr:MAG: hypothetical protein CVV51_02840 [Spirochaetae bacterium HGW-Spirochaetae-7]